MDNPACEDGETCPVMLQANSLKELINISDSPEQRSKLRQIIICTDHVSEELFKCIQPSGLAPHDSQEVDGIPDMDDYSLSENDSRYIDAQREHAAAVKGVNMGAYYTCLWKQQDFTSGLDVAYLTRAMTQLPNCKKICISDAYSPLGSAQLEQSIGTKLCKGFNHYSRHSRNFVMHVLRTTLIAISISRIQVNELDICLGLASERDSHSITDDALSLPKEYRQLMHRGFVTINTLRLVVDTQNDSDWDENISSFLGLFPNLSHFRLHLADGGSSVEFSHLTEALQTVPLQVFELVNCSTTQANLMPLLLCRQAADNQAALKKIVLNGVNIESGKYGTWSWVKDHLRTKLPSCSLDLQYCQVEGQVRMPPTTSWHYI